MTIKKILISEAKEGMVVAADTFDELGRLIVPKDTKLDKEMINKLESYSVFIIKILDGYIENVDQEVEGYYEKIGATKEFENFEKIFNQSVLKLRNEFNDIVEEPENIDEQELLNGLKNIINANTNNNNMLDMLNCMRGYDDLTYVHCISVALICSVMSDWLGYSEAQKDELMLAGLLHDIGKLKIPKQIIVKPGKLTDAEYKVIKYHPRLGYEILKKSNVSDSIKNAALMHHERYDGKGYPDGMRGEDIDDFARIIAIADVYDAMTANRVYREGLCPFDVIDYLQRSMVAYDPKYLFPFLEHTAQMYVSNKVRLSDGQTGKVAMINKFEIGNPVVIVNNRAIDLSKEKDLKIVKLM